MQWGWRGAAWLGAERWTETDRNHGKLRRHGWQALLLNRGSRCGREESKMYPEDLTGASLPRWGRVGNTYYLEPRNFQMPTGYTSGKVVHVRHLI